MWRPDRMLFLKILYFGPSHISLNESWLRSPIIYSAFLSKQQGITFPSHVITGLNQSLAHLSDREFFISYSPSLILYLLNLSLIHISEPTRLGMISYAV